MRRAALTTLVLCLAVPFAALADDETRSPISFRPGVTLGFAPGTPNAFGIGGIVEVEYALLDQLRIGGRADGEALVGIDIANLDLVNVATYAVAAYLLKVEWDFLGGDVRPFVGVGLGGYTTVVIAVGAGSGGSSTSILAGTGFGVMPQLGFNFGGFRVAGQYHAVLTGPGARAANYFQLELSWRVF